MEDLYLKACEDGAINIVAKYVRKGLNVNYQDKLNGSTGLMKACFNGHYHLVKFLLESDATVNLTDFYGQNALHYATKSNNERICKLLCHTGVESSETTRIANLQPKDYAMRSVPNETKNEFVEKEYLTWTKAMRKYEMDSNFITDKDKPRNTEEKIYDLIWRYDNMVLSEMESDGENEVKGEVYKKPKKKKAKKGKKGRRKKAEKRKRNDIKFIF